MRLVVEDVKKEGEIAVILIFFSYSYHRLKWILQLNVFDVPTDLFTNPPCVCCEIAEDDRLPKAWAAAMWSKTDWAAVHPWWFMLTAAADAIPGWHCRPDGTWGSIWWLPVVLRTVLVMVFELWSADPCAAAAEYAMCKALSVMPDVTGLWKPAIPP